MGRPVSSESCSLHGGMSAPIQQDPSNSANINKNNKLQTNKNYLKIKDKCFDWNDSLLQPALSLSCLV
jgi:azurin